MKPALLFICLILAGCGVKPGAVEPPGGKGASAFPRTYPDPATDPVPDAKMEAR